jgi:hypothetical protein
MGVDPLCFSDNWYPVDLMHCIPPMLLIQLRVGAHHHDEKLQPSLALLGLCLNLLFGCTYSSSNGWLAPYLQLLLKLHDPQRRVPEVQVA